MTVFRNFLGTLLFCPPDGAWRKATSLARPPKSAFTQAAISRPLVKVLSETATDRLPFFVSERKGKTPTRFPFFYSLFALLQKHRLPLTWSRLCLRLWPNLAKYLMSATWWPQESTFCHRFSVCPCFALPDCMIDVNQFLITQLWWISNMS